MKNPLEYTNVRKLMEVFAAQDSVVVESGDWHKVGATVSREKDGRICVEVESDDLSFYFDKDGRFQGICNYKQ